MKDFYQGNMLRTGFTTGTCAAAAAQAAVCCLSGQFPEAVMIHTAEGDLRISIYRQEKQGNGYLCSVIKDAGDDPDITNGLEICAYAQWNTNCEISIDGGQGVGRITKKGMKTPVGSAAINPVPLQMIRESVREVLPAGTGVDIVISVPEGEKVAARTFNPKLGIVGGISILGTTGIVHPMSEEAYKDSLAMTLKLLAAERNECAFVPGEQGRKLLTDSGVAEENCVLTSNYLGFMLDYAGYVGIQRILLAGSLGKLIKVAAGIFQTHSRVADGRMETLAAFAALEGADRETVSEIYDCVTTSQVVEILDEKKLGKVYDRIVDRIIQRVTDYTGMKISIEVLLFTDDGRLLAQSAGAEEFARNLGNMGVDPKIVGRSE